MKHVTQQNNFIYFTVALLLLLLASAFVDSVPESQGMMLVELFILITHIVAYVSLNFGRYWRYFVVSMFVIISIANLLNRFTDWSAGPLIALTFTLIFYVGVALTAARKVLFPDEVNANIVVGALAIYMLLGLIWATLYLIVMEFFPNAFNGIEHIYWGDNFSNALYYSYITMTTVGYGEITPAITISRTLAYMQAMIGTFYMAVVVASLISARR
ncbi:MAG: ion channel [Halioglobus sp.]|jgi:voltage-gated potassium channel Kch